jgi:hypothetical protein
VSHGNAPLTELGRLRPARCVVDDGWPLRRAADRFQVSVTTGQPVRRYEHAGPGDLIHVDVEKLGNIPDGGGHRTQGRAQGKLNRTPPPDTALT